MDRLLPPGWLPEPLQRQFAGERTDAYRIFSSPDAWIERLGADLLISYKSEAALASLLHETQANWPESRVFGRFLTRQNAERAAPILLAGPPDQPLETIVGEQGLRYGIDFAAGYSVGLFLDQRGNRAFLRKQKPRRVLNTFAYTCSFSVAAASAGAETVSIDLSKKSLTRGKQNFELNSLSLTSHRFLTDDVLEVLPRLARKMETFDAIILDPPTFSRSATGRRFQVEDHLAELLHLALNLAAPKACLLLSTNCTRLSLADLESIIKGELRVAARRGKTCRAAPLPDFPPGEGATALWLLLE